MPKPVKSSYNGKGIYRPAHQTQKVDSSIPVYKYLTPQAGSIGGAWATAGHFLDFQIPQRTIETLNGQMLRFSVTNGGSTITACPPTPYWVENIEVRIGSELVETIYSRDIFTETCGFLSLDELDSLNEVIKTGTDYVTSDQSLLGSETTYAYLPFKCLLNACKLYLKTLDDQVQFRVYFPDQFWGANSGASNGVKLSDVTLILEEAKANDAASQADAHKSGITYGTIVRQHQTIQSARGNDDGEKQLDLTGINGHSAGLMVYADKGGKVAGVAGGTTNDLVRRFEVSNLTLLDQMGSKITEKFEGDWLRSFVWLNQIGTPYPARTHGNTYLVPFADSFRFSVETGVHTGERKLTGNEKLLLGAIDGNTPNATWNVHVTNYRYVSLVFFDNKFVRIVRNFD
jgi:hypothetical protein